MLRPRYRNCLALAENRGLASIAFPAISTGVYGYPLRDAADIAVSKVRATAAKALRRVVFTCFDETVIAVYAEVVDETIAVYAEVVDETRSD